MVCLAVDRNLVGGVEPNEIVQVGQVPSSILHLPDYDCLALMKRIGFVLVTALCGLLPLVAGCGKKRAPGAEIALSPAPKGLPKIPFDSKSSGFANWCLTWSKDMCVNGYEQFGSKNPRWDAAALDALEEYAHLRATGRARDPSDSDNLDTQLRKAVKAGCNDPLIRYLYLLRIAHPPRSATPQTAAEYSSLAKQMEASGYATLFKFYVNLRTAEAWRAAFAKQAPEVNQFRRQAMEHFQTAIRYQELPANIVNEACRDLYEAIDQNKKQRTDFYTQAVPILLSRWSDEGFPYLVKARFYLDYAWEARGSGWASEVSEKDGRLFADRLAIAEEAVDKAWKKDPSLAATPLAALRLELGQGKGRERMETWYKRALTFRQNHAEAIRQKQLYLQPYWYGTEEEVVAFAREIAKSDLYYSQELLQPYFAHRDLAHFFRKSRPGYWTEPQVWPDLEACFERFFDRSGDDQAWRHTYAWCAARCGQWKALEEQLSKITEVKYDYFGGKEAYEQLKTTAHERANRSQ